MSAHVLLIPPEGIFQVLHSDLPIDVRSFLEDTEGGGTFVTVNFGVFGHPDQSVHFVHTPTGTLNPRARSVLACLTGAHVVLTGTVAFTGLEPERVTELVRDWA